MNTHKIDKAKYTGYLWYSDAKQPVIYYETEEEIQFNDSDNPFIVEGWLTDGNKSFHIQYLDGKHNIYEYDLDVLKKVKHKELRFMPSFKEFKQLVFNQYWLPESDKLCEGMEVLVPAEFVFVGLIR